MFVTVWPQTARLSEPSAYGATKNFDGSEEGCAWSRWHGVAVVTGAPPARIECIVMIGGATRRPTIEVSGLLEASPLYGKVKHRIRHRTLAVQEVVVRSIHHSNLLQLLT